MDSRRRCSRRSGSGTIHSWRRGILLSVMSVSLCLHQLATAGNVRGDPEVLAKGRHGEKERTVDLEVRRNGSIESEPFRERAQTTTEENWMSCWPVGEGSRRQSCCPPALPKLQCPATRHRLNSISPRQRKGQGSAQRAASRSPQGPTHHPPGTCSCSFGAPPTGRGLSASSTSRLTTRDTLQFPVPIHHCHHFLINRHVHP